MASPATRLAERVAALLEKTDIVASTPHSLDTMVHPFFKDEQIENHPPQSVIGLLQRGLQAEAAADWGLRCVPRPWKSMPSLSQIHEGTRHALPEMPVPSPAPPGHLLRLPELYLSAYSDQDVDTVPSLDNVACILVRDVLVDTITVLDFNRIASAKSLIDVDCFFPRTTFAARATPFDKLKDLPQGQSTWKPEDVAVDAVFSQMFQLPSPEHRLVYFHSVLTEACKIAPAAIAPSLGRAIRYLYRRLDVMDLELQHRFLNWFSHHLSNFGFTWKWTEWYVFGSSPSRRMLSYYRIDDLELPSTHVKKAFIAGLLEKEIRLSVVQRVQGTLPTPYHNLLPELKDEDEAPKFRFANDGRSAWASL